MTNMYNVQFIKRIALHGIARAKLTDLDMHYLRIGTITVKIHKTSSVCKLNTWPSVHEKCMTAKVSENTSNGAAPSGNRRVSRKVHPKGIPRS